MLGPFSFVCLNEIAPKAVSVNIASMARQELTTTGLRLYREDDGTHWLHLGENAMSASSICLAPKS